MKRKAFSERDVVEKDKRLFARIPMAQAGIGKVVEVDPQPVPIGKLPPQLDPRAEFNRITQILPPPIRIVAPRESRGE